MSRSIRLAVILGILLIGCDRSQNSGSSTGPEPAPTLTVTGLSSSVLPDSVLWTQGSARGKVAVDVGTGRTAVTLDLSGLPAASRGGARTLGSDTVWISFWTRGILTTRIPYVSGATSDSVVPGPGRDSVAWTVLAVRDSLQAATGSVPTVAQVYAQLVLNGDSRLAAATLPTGLAVDSVRIEGIRLAGSAALSTEKLKSLKLDSTIVDSLRKALGIPVDTAAPSLRILRPSRDTTVASGIDSFLVRIAASAASGIDSVRIGNHLFFGQDSTGSLASFVGLVRGTNLVVVAARSRGGRWSRDTLSITRLSDTAARDTNSMLTDVQRKAFAPTFTVSMWSPGNPVKVTMKTSLSAGTIHYTLDGSAPDFSSPIYSSPVPLSRTTTIRAVTMKDSVVMSIVSNTSVTVPDSSEKPVTTDTVGSDSLRQASAPVFSVPGGTYSKPQKVALSTPLAGGTIHYTVDGSVPDLDSPEYTDSLSITKNTTITAVVLKDAAIASVVSQARYVISTGIDTTVKKDTTTPVLSDSLRQVIAPMFSVAGGTYSKSQTVALSTRLSGGIILYTTDGTVPTASSLVYHGPLTVNQTTTIQAVTLKDTLIASVVSQARYVISTGIDTTVKKDTTTPVLSDSLRKVYAPVFSVPGGTYSKSQTVALSTRLSGGIILYTTDGTIPTASSLVYHGPLTVNQTTTIQAVTLKDTLIASVVSQARYVIAPAIDTTVKKDTTTPVLSDSLRKAYAPVFSVPGGTYSKSVTFSLSSSLAGARIVYTADGTVPNYSSTVYTGPITLTKSYTIRAAAWKDTINASVVSQMSYVISTGIDTTVKKDTTTPVLSDSLRQVIAPMFSVPGGTYTKSQTVALSTRLSGGIILYTTDGTVPTASSLVYHGPLTVNQTTTIQAVTLKDTLIASVVSQAKYVISPATDTTEKKDTTVAAAIGPPGLGLETAFLGSGRQPSGAVGGFGRKEDEIVAPS